MVSLRCILALGLVSAAAAQTSSAAVSTFACATDTSSSHSEDISNTSALLNRHLAGSSYETKSVSPSELPIFFFHGLTTSAEDGANIAARMTADGRTIHALDFCEGECSVISLHTQLPLAIAQIRSIIAKDPKSYANGYIFLAHSQGGMIGRAVIEEMDDHNVLMFITLAGVLNGVFYGPQAADAVPVQVFASYFAPATIPTTVLNISSYSQEQLRGQMQHDFIETLAANRDLGNQISMANLWRSPDYAPWFCWNSWLPLVNNINVCTDTECKQAKARRKTNFLKLHAFHSLVSARDGAVSPWQSSHFAKYSDLSDAAKIVTDFEQLTVVPMQQTPEYMGDTYGLKTLHTSGRLHLREVADVSHNCWVKDGTFFDNSSEICSFDAAFNAYVYPLLASTTKLSSRP